MLLIFLFPFVGRQQYSAPNRIKIKVFPTKNLFRNLPKKRLQNIYLTKFSQVGQGGGVCEVWRT